MCGFLKVNRVIGDRRRSALLAELAQAATEKVRECPVLHALHVGCGANAIGATQAELDAAIRDHALVLFDPEEWRAQ